MIGWLIGFPLVAVMVDEIYICTRTHTPVPVCLACLLSQCHLFFPFSSSPPPPPSQK